MKTNYQQYSKVLMNRKLIIAIDGPAGAGKSTIARIVAKELGYVYIDTGAMFRALTWKALKEKTNLHEPESLTLLAKNTRIDFKHGRAGNVLDVLLDGEEVSGRIRTERVSLHTN